MLDFDLLHKEYEYYKNYIIPERVRLTKKISEYEATHDLNVIDPIGDYLSSKSTLFVHDEELKKYKEAEPDLDKIKKARIEYDKYFEYKRNKKKINKLLIAEFGVYTNCFYDEFRQLVIFDDNDKKYLVDLNYLEKYDITNEDSEFIEFIKKAAKGSFIGEIDILDLPLLMAIKEDIEIISDLNDTPEEDRTEESYYIQQSFIDRIMEDYIKAKLADRKSVRAFTDKGYDYPFVYNSDIQLKLWDKLDQDKPLLSDSEMLIRYYKLLLLFGMM